MGRCQRGTITPQCASNLIPNLTCDSHVKRKKEHRVGTGIQWGQSETLVTEIMRIYEPSRLHLKSYNFSPPCLRTNNSLKNLQSLQRNRVHHKNTPRKKKSPDDEETLAFIRRTFHRRHLTLVIAQAKGRFPYKRPICQGWGTERMGNVERVR